MISKTFCLAPKHLISPLSTNDVCPEQTLIQTNRHTEAVALTQEDRWTNRQTDGREMCKQMDRWMIEQMDRLINKSVIDRKIDRQTDEQIGHKMDLMDRQIR
jgi:hypothetical protein